MTIQPSTFRSESTASEIYRITVEPELPPVGTVLALHGLGDHIHCHEKAFRLFYDHGYRVEGFDWPGNGQSAGRRGDIPGIRSAMRLIEEFIGLMAEPPVGIYAHSTGGFIALPFLSRYQKTENALQWLWMSSPLLRPSHKQSKAKIAISEFIADFFPDLTVSTGVRPSRCFHVSNFDAKEISKEFHRCHSKISARFGRDLLLWEPRIFYAASKLREPLNVLITQGDEDTICPIEYTQELFQSIPLENKTLVPLESLRHEPLREPENLFFINSVSNWLDSVVAESKLTTPNKLETL